MRVALAGGAEVDLATQGELTERLERMAVLLRRPEIRFRRIPAFITTPAAIGKPPIIPSDGRIYTPPAGALWAVQWVRTQAADPGTAVANVSMVGYIGSAAVGNMQAAVSATAAAGDDANAFTTLLAIPSLSTVPPKTIVYPSEQVYFAIAGTGGNIGALAKYGVVLAVLEVPNTPQAIAWL